MSACYTARMRERVQRALLGVVGVMALALGATVCTTFSGLEADTDAGVPSVDSGAEASGEAGDAGIETGPDAATQSYLSLEDAAKACTMMFGCPYLAKSVVWSMAVPVDDLNYSLCLSWLAGPISKQRIGFGLQADALACIAEAASCDEAGACLWVELMAPGDPRCADAGPEDRCADDAGSVVLCQYQYVIHCDSAYYTPGATCMDGTNNWKGCGLEPDCTSVTSCVGPVLTYCAMDTLKYGINCAYGGYGCGFEADSGYPCVPDEGFKECTIPGASRCADDTVWICDGLYESAFDCASIGFECTDLQGAAQCAPPSPACTPTDATQNVCHGTSIDVCVGGSATTFDCESIGLSCVPGAQGKSAHCG